MNNWLDLSDNANTFLSTMVDGFVDTSGGNIIVRENQNLEVSGDASFNQRGSFAVPSLKTDVLDTTGLVELAVSKTEFVENPSFIQYAYDISGAESGGLAGQSISKNLSGDIIAVGAPLNSGGGTARGEVRVYQKNNDSWLQLGNDLNGTKDNEEFGHSVDLNGDGTILAVGTKDISHNTLVYKYDSGSWGLYGNSIYLNNNLNPRSETSVVATSDTAEFVVSFEFRGNDYSAGNIPTSYSDSTDSSAVSSVSTTSYIDDELGLGGTGRFTCTAPSVSFDLIEIYYYAVSVGGNNYIINADSTDTTLTTMNIRLGINGDFQVYAKTNGVNVLRWWGDYGSTTSATNTWNHLVVQPKERKFWINGVQKNYTSYNIWASSGNWQTTYSTINPFRMRNGGSTDGNFCRYFRLHSAPASVSSYVSTLYTNRDVVNFGYDTVTTVFSHENCSTKPKLNKIGDKLTILSEQHFDDLSGNGQVQSYQYSESDASWNYLGDKIESAAFNDISGGDIAINDEGNMIAVGYPQSKSSIQGTYSYSVKLGSGIYEFYGEEFTSDTANPVLTFKRGSTYNLTLETGLLSHPFWIQTTENSGRYDSGNVYNNGVTNNGSGSGTITFVVPSDAPDTLYYRCEQHENMGNSISIVNESGNDGRTKVFKYNTTDSSWNQVGNNIDGEGQAGTAVVMDGSGDFVAIGSPNVNAGEVNVYQNVADTWTLYGNKIEGQSVNDQFGTSIDMTPVGNILAVGAVNANAGKGNVNIYQYNETDSSWNQLGGDLSGTEVGDLTGTSVKLNQTGTEVSVGEPQPPTTSPSSTDATEIATFLSGDGNRQYVLIRINSGVGRRDGFINYTSAFNLAYLNNNYLITTSDETFDGIDITLISDASVPSVTGTNANIQLPFGDPNETTTGSNLDAIAYVSTFGGSGGTNYHSPHLVKTTSVIIPTSSSDDSYFLVENTDYPSIKNLGKVRTFEIEHTKFYNGMTNPTFGIGVTNPTNRLDVDGTVYIDGKLQTNDLSQNSGTTTISGDLTLNGSISVSSANNSSLTYDTDMSVNLLKRLFVNPNDISTYGEASQTHASDLSDNTPPLIWNQIATHYNPEPIATDYFGYAVDINGDGTVIVVSVESNYTGSQEGRVGVFQYDGANWSQKGDYMYGMTDLTSANAGAAECVSINYYGNRVAWGAKTARPDSGYDRGYVLAYDYNEGTNTWDLMGGDVVLKGTSNSNQVGDKQTVSLNKSADSSIDGKFLSTAVRSLRQAYVYEWDGSAWNQKGTTIDDGDSNNRPSSVKMSDDGTALVVGMYNAGTNTIGSDNGAFAVYYWSGSDWTLRGDYVYGTNASDQFGRCVDINSDGTIVVATALKNDDMTADDGHMRIFQYNSSNDTWEQKGNTVTPSTELAVSYSSIQLGGYDALGMDGAGSKIVVGTWASTLKIGYLYEYSSASNTWEITNEFTRAVESSGYYYPYCCRMSRDGHSVIIGDYSYYSNGLNYSGAVDVYQLPTVSPVYEFDVDISFNHSLVVPGNLVIIDGSNNTSYGSYTTYTSPDIDTIIASPANKSYHVGKSKSNVFNIVNQDNIGVYMNTGDTSFTSTSDERLKHNIQDTEDSLEKICALQPRKFKWKYNDKSESGFIAQEIEKVFPEMVDENTLPDGKTIKGVNHSSLLPYILDSLQSLDKEIDNLIDE